MGFEWAMVVDESRKADMEDLLTELSELHGSRSEAVRYFAWEVAFGIYPPGGPNDSFLSCDEGDGKKYVVVTYGEVFGADGVKSGQIGLWAEEIVWLFKMPANVKAEFAAIFDKHGCMDVWLSMVGESCSGVESARSLFGDALTLNKSFQE
ncbi:MAG: hypothetical protein Q7T04_04950 [Dehalococcoidia bacterium]|nr:hypothetical protein [Dehalococcoidia bacterium]